jgi:hypothetical protein
MGGPGSPGSCGTIGFGRGSFGSPSGSYGGAVEGTGVAGG